IFAGLRIALSLGLIVAIVTEMFIGTTVGLGRRIIDAQLVYRVPEMYAAIILTGILGYVLNRLFLWYERRTIHWSGR
ncbi:TPA: ABC transporter permease, partial [Candidatus Micrarchaeota archaeon]|nr:ABC transporter permease [Candidatus Micrarchaeota archaeon]